MGGMSADYEPTNKVYHLDLTFSKFVNKKDMKFERLFEGGQGAFRSANGSIFVLNGCLDSHECEKYKPNKDNWELIPSYSDVSDQTTLNLFVGCLIRDNIN